MDRLQQALAWSFPLGRAFGIRVRVYWTVFLVLLASAWQFAALPGVGWIEGLALGGLATAVLYAVILTHEVGHAAAARRWAVRTDQITLSALGGLAHLSAAAPSPRAEVGISLAGPAVHILWVALAWGLGQVLPLMRLGEYGLAFDAAAYLLDLNLWLGVFNLLPFFPMDGGRALRALLAMRMHPNRATLWACRLGVLGGIAIGAWGLATHGLAGTLLLVIGFNNALRCMQEMAWARVGEGPYFAPPDPWARDAEGWKDGGWAQEDEPAARPARRPKRRATPLAPPTGAAPKTLPSAAVGTASRRPGRTPEESEELDRLLDRVAEVGVGGLTPQERERLLALSRAGPR
jgi:Zn-dependent protease